MHDLIGQLVHARYHIVGLVGEGAMGSVYRARSTQDPSLWLALKVLKPHLTHDPKFGVRFAQEAATLKRLSHPSIVPLHDHFQENGRYFIALSYIDGLSLADMIDQEGPLAETRALDLFKTVLAALDYAHLQGFIHRDVKPSNILIDRAGRPWLCDFGIAREIGGRRLTAAGTTLGTPEYMSPEQIQGLSTLDHRTDVYSAGIVLFEMLTGRVPFGGDGKDSDFVIRQQHLQRDAPDPRTINPAIDERLARIVLKSMRKDPARRYQGCADFRAAIETYEQGRDGSVEPARSEASGVRSGSGSRRYAVYMHPTLGAAAVKNGFSWPALLGNLFWMLGNGLYPKAIVWAAAYLLLFVVVASNWPSLLLAGLFLLWLVPGFRGNSWRERELARRGYRLSRTVAAQTAEAAVLQVAG